MSDAAAGRPTVAVLMPVYNAERTVGSAIESVLRQTWRRLELIVVNDGSTDGTASILADRARRDQRVRVVEQANSGIVAALNNGWKRCHATYVARMDADDLCLPWRISTQVAYMERRPEVAASGTAILPFHSAPPFIGVPAKFPAEDPAIRTRLLFNPPIMHPTAMFRRSAIGDTPPYSPTMPHAEDYELWTRLALSHRLGNVGTVGLLYRRSAGSISSSRRDEQLRQAGELRLRNLARSFDAAFVERNAALHLELMHRRFSPSSLLAQMPEYVSTLMAAPVLSRDAVELAWFGYCLAYARTGGDAAALFTRVNTPQPALRTLALRLGRAAR